MSEFTKFDYLLNAMMHAAQHERPASQDYKGKREAVKAYVADLEQTIAMLRTGDTCARMCEGTAFRIEARRLKARCAELEAELSKANTVQWQEIESAPEDALVVVGWLDEEDHEHPERHDLDFKEDGGWVRHADSYDNYCMVAPPESQGPKERAPYVLWLSIPCLQSAIAEAKP